jgi:hypothetical protein
MTAGDTWKIILVHFNLFSLGNAPSPTNGGCIAMFTLQELARTDCTDPTWINHILSPRNLEKDKLGLILSYGYN